MEQKLMQLDNAKAAVLNKLLGDLESRGEVVVAELRPSLNGLLTDAALGGFAGRVFLGENKGLQIGVEMKTMGTEDTHEVNVLELKDATGDFNGEVFGFNASNGGLKAKVAKVKDLKYVLVVFRGENAADQKGHNPWKDYGIVGANSLEALKPVYLEAKKSLKAA